jgi:hypothetical protein
MFPVDQISYLDLRSIYGPVDLFDTINAFPRLEVLLLLFASPTRWNRLPLRLCPLRQVGVELVKKRRTDPGWTAQPQAVFDVVLKMLADRTLFSRLSAIAFLDCDPRKEAVEW